MDLASSSLAEGRNIHFSSLLSSPLLSSSPNASFTDRERERQRAKTNIDLSMIIHLFSLFSFGGEC